MSGVCVWGGGGKDRPKHQKIHWRLRECWAYVGVCVCVTHTTGNRRRKNGEIGRETGGGSV